MYNEQQANNRYNNYKAKEAARDVCVKALQAANPDFISGNGCVIAAKNIRKELKKAFQGVKFSVTSESFSMGNAVRISWTDGPTDESVSKITDKYSEGTFDGMTDCYNYERSYWTDAFGSAKYISTSRHYSDEFTAKVIDTIAEKYGDKDKPSVFDVRNGYAMNVTPFDGGADNNNDWNTLIHRTNVKSTIDNIVVGY